MFKKGRVHSRVHPIFNLLWSKLHTTSTNRACGGKCIGLVVNTTSRASLRGVNDFSCEVSRQVWRHCEARERRGNPLTVIARKSLIFAAIHLVNVGQVCPTYYSILYIFIFSSLFFKEEKMKQKRRNIVVMNALRA